MTWNFPLVKSRSTKPMTPLPNQVPNNDHK